MKFPQGGFITLLKPISLWTSLFIFMRLLYVNNTNACVLGHFFLVWNFPLYPQEHVAVQAILTVTDEYSHARPGLGFPRSAILRELLLMFQQTPKMAHVGQQLHSQKGVCVCVWGGLKGQRKSQGDWDGLKENRLSVCECSSTLPVLACILSKHHHCWHTASFHLSRYQGLSWECCRGRRMKERFPKGGSE